MLDATPHTGAAAAERANHHQGLTANVNPQFVAVATFIGLMVLVFALSLARTGGTFSYTLDDPYIHLALAERLADGHYGINPGEITSPSSSVIWPFLLLPGVGTPFHPYLPLLLNLVFGAITAWLFGRFASQLPLSSADTAAPFIRIAIAVLLIFATNQIGLAFTGMEHTLQVMLAVAASLGLIEFMRGKSVPDWAIAAAALGPAVRYEMFAITAAVALALLAERRWRHLLALSIASLVLPAALSLFLVSQGVMPLPNSVMLKLSVIPKPNGLPFPLNMIVPTHWHNALQAKLVMWAMIGSIAAVGWQSTGRLRWLCASVTLAGLLHMLLGRFGWFYRYEVYAIAFCALPALWLAAERVPKYLVFLCLPMAAVYAAPIIQSPAAAQNIYEQQYQMHRFVTEHYKQPFAVNDLGWLSYRIDPKLYVLDLWGLASNEALIKARTRTPEWLDDVTRRHGAGLAMIYADWFPDLPATWTRVGELQLSSPAITPASESVAFYATGAGDAAAIIRDLEAFKPTLPPGVVLTIFRN